MVNASKKNLENVQIDALDLLVLLYYYLYYCITMLLNYMSWLLSKAVFTSEYLLHEHFQVKRPLVRVPNLYFGSRLGAQYPKNSKIFLWLLLQPSFGDALV